MSYGREAAVEREIERELVYAHAVSEAEKGLWTMRGGKKIHVSEMTDSHISNCLAMLKRGCSPYADPFICMFEAEQRKRGTA